jgi:hypothetical protein
VTKKARRRPCASFRAPPGRKRRKVFLKSTRTSSNPGRLSWTTGGDVATSSWSLMMVSCFILLAVSGKSAIDCWPLRVCQDGVCGPIGHTIHAGAYSMRGEERTQ